MSRPSVTACLLLSLLASGAAGAAPGRAVPSGCDALVGARVIVSPGRIVEDATLLIRDGRVVDVRTGLDLPADARVRRVDGMTIWPAFVDPHVTLERLSGKAEDADGDGGGDDEGGGGPRREGSATGAANRRIHPELRAADVLALDPEAVAALRAQGIATVLAVPGRGILRGRGAVVALRDLEPGQPASSLVLAQDGAMHAAFETTGEDGGYPDSVMGAVALMRQTLLDARWHGEAVDHARRHDEAPRPVADASLAALHEAVSGRRGAGLAVECRDVLDALRAGSVAREMGLALRLIGAGDEYRRLPEIRALACPVIVPVDFPAAARAIEADEWLDVPLETLRHWDLAPDTPRLLQAEGVSVSLTTHGLADVSDFTARTRRAIEHGLAPDDALAMLTTRPARLLGLAESLGTLEPGRTASFVVAWGPPFAKGTEIRETWVEGRRHVVSRDPEGPRGRWLARLGTDRRWVEGVLEIKDDGGTFSWTPEDAAVGVDQDDHHEEDEEDGKPRKESERLDALTLDRGRATFEMDGEPAGVAGKLELAVRVEAGALAGSDAEGRVALTGLRLRGPDPDAPWPPDVKLVRTPPPRPGPLEEGDDVRLSGVTAWTCGAAGVIPSAEVVVRDGRIVSVTPTPERAASGLHLTPGLIDAHSHAAIAGGVNEATHSCTAEVRIADVVDSENRNLYRQLAGGLTTANLLHGSANAMGGQSQTIKLRWGLPPEGLAFEGSMPGIKFALGENVKQSNWGEKHVTRFPQTRMGVEQLMREKFLEARDYRDRWRRWEDRRQRPRMLPPRRDLQLEALVEVMDGRRTVHCHSYRADEILMMLRVAEEFGFRMGTFQHVLEGYKVADELAAHGAMASSFSDWWAYKFEVYDAIPYNGALMHERGVVVSFNSDSSELARRMNLEAAKAVKWGGVAPEEALLFVTRNAARQLGVEHRVGALEPGKDADLALWDGPPLSTGSKVVRTWVDGRLWFDREADLAGRAAVEQERGELVARARSERGDESGKGGGFDPTYGIMEQHCMDGTHGESQP